MRAALLILLASSPALALGSIEGEGRVSIQGGYRWSPDDHFEQAAAAAGNPIVRKSWGGLQGSAGFGYGALEWLEAAIDLFGGWESFDLDGYARFHSVSYGAMLGARFVARDLFFQGFQPWIGVQVGPTIINISTASFGIPETVVAGLAVSGGVMFRFGDRFALTLEARYLMARGMVPGIGGLNGGGGWFSVGFAMFFAPSMKRDLPVPGF